MMRALMMRRALAGVVVIAVAAFSPVAVAAAPDAETLAVQAE